MEYNFFVTKEFERVMKRLSKKYRSLPTDFANFKDEFISNYPQIGVDLGSGYKKIRMEITSKGKGKSAGARIITYDLCIKVEECNILIVTMFDKNEYDNISDDFYKTLVEDYKKEHEDS